ncbi:beta-N-acetylhexosaminidase [Cohnella terricola]|uniref:Beta-N-acetylhexosaminidase n=1 Tax=Cohnella terricola TaxID=1289167 RepID=A0A559JL57_9BACL|nr:beta-N-acetylhexosaminidase [Cohnella terricola]TVY00611.1 beta-N-acetylhexosaminidase [Cohnella terricola]
MKAVNARYSGILCICVFLALIVGCGSGNPGPSGESSVPPSLPSETSQSSVQPSPTPTGEPSPTDEDEIAGMMKDMTLEQKIGQMILAGIDGTSFDTAMKKMIAEQHVGGIILYKNNFSDLEGSVGLVNALKKANENNPVPLFMSVDQEGGKVSRLPKDFVAIPDAAKVGKTGDPKLARQMGSLLSEELRIMGFNVDFAPVLDINSNPNNPVIGSRAFGSDAERVTKMGVAAMKGLQEGGTVAVVKHFPGHGDTSVDSHLELPVVHKTTDQLEAMEWVPFRTAIEEGADAVMVAHIFFPVVDPDAPASFSKVIIGEQLRGTLGFDGVVITDDMTMGAIAQHYGLEDAALKSVEAGSDIILVAHGYDTEKKVYDSLLQAIQSGRLDEARIDESVRRILTLKFKYQLSDSPVPVPSVADLPNEAIRDWLRELK